MSTARKPVSTKSTGMRGLHTEVSSGELADRCSRTPLLPATGVVARAASGGWELSVQRFYSDTTLMASGRVEPGRAQPFTFLCSTQQWLHITIAREHQGDPTAMHFRLSWVGLAIIV